MLGDDPMMWLLADDAIISRRAVCGFRISVLTFACLLGMIKDDNSSPLVFEMIRRTERSKRDGYGTRRNLESGSSLRDTCRDSPKPRNLT